MSRLVYLGWNGDNGHLHQPEQLTNIEGHVPRSATHTVMYYYFHQDAVITLRFPSLNHTVKYSLASTHLEDSMYLDQFCTFSAAERRNICKSVLERVSDYQQQELRPFGRVPDAERFPQIRYPPLATIVLL